MRDLFLKTVLNGLYFSGLRAVSDFWTGGLGAILMLHHVRDHDGSQFAPNHHLQVTPKFLDRVLTALKASGHDLVSLDHMQERLKIKPDDNSRRMIAITLDDGYRDNLQNAVPIFRKHNCPYTIFIAPGLIDGSADLWWEDLAAIIAARDEIRVALSRGHKDFDTSSLAKKQGTFNQLLHWLTNEVSEEEQRKIIRELAWMYKIDTRAHCTNQLMNWSEIGELTNDPLCTIGAHTIHHYALARLEKTDAERQMRESAKILKSELDQAPRHFAYPYGYPAAAGQREFDLARELGFTSAVTTRHGVLYNDHKNHMHALPRISLNGNFQSMRYVDTLLSGLPTRLQNRGKKLNVG